MSEIESKVKAIIVDKLGVDEAEVKPEASFTNDLGADSLDTVELIMVSLFLMTRLRLFRLYRTLSTIFRKTLNNKLSERPLAFNVDSVIKR